MIHTQKPYFIRAIFEWCNDQNFTPYIEAMVDQHTHVPTEFVQNHRIVLDISFDATKNLDIGNEWINFSASFGSILHDIAIPTHNITAIFAKENGYGMQFEITQDRPPHNPPSNGGLRLVK